MAISLRAGQSLAQTIRVTSSEIQSPLGDEFRRIARLIIDEVAPPTNMAGCSARMLDMVAAALDAADRP
jgi:Flp pilus assembly protein TadB